MGWKWKDISGAAARRSMAARLSAMAARSAKAGRFAGSWLGDAAVRRARDQADLLWPPQCVVCQAPLAASGRCWICRRCRREMFGPDRPRCPRCAALLADTGVRCPECRLRAFRFDAAAAVGPYEGRLREVVLQMKQAHHQITAYHVGRMLALRRRRQASWGEVDLVVPMPKYWLDRIRRGTNAAEWIARGVAAAIGAPLSTRTLVKIRPTRKQSLLSETQRRGNLRGALGVRRAEAVAGKRILLVDDLLTTGASASEAARVLRRARAAEVRVAVVARAQLLRPSPPVSTRPAPVAAHPCPAEQPGAE